MDKSKRSPQRTCVGCRTTRAQHELLRLVRRPDGAVAISPGKKAPGRGAYLCFDASCVERARRRRSLERALKTAIGDELWETIEQVIHDRTAGDSAPN